MPHGSLVVGRVEVIPLCDGWAPLPLSDEMPGAASDWDVERGRFPWAFPPDDPLSWAWHVHAFLVRHPDGPVLVDTGIGHFGRPPFDVVGRIDEELGTLGVSTDEIRDVIYTHLHADHSGGACRPDGSPRFPNARHHVHPDDWTFFAEHRTPEDFTGRFAMGELDGLGLLELDPSDREVRSGLFLLYAPGHTPGHRAVRLADGDGTLLLTGDLLHVPPQIRDPSWPSNHDEDADLGARERTRLVEIARAEEWTVAVSHFGRPFGRVDDTGWSSV